MTDGNWHSDKIIIGINVDLQKLKNIYGTSKRRRCSKGSLHR